MNPEAPRACGHQLSGFARTLGALMTDNGEGFILSPTGDLVGNPLLPALHGGAVASFLELAAQLALTRVLALPRPPQLISVNLQFVAPARLSVLSTAPKVRRVGRRIAVVHAEAFHEEGARTVCFANLEFSTNDAVD